MPPNVVSGRPKDSRRTARNAGVGLLPAGAVTTVWPDDDGPAGRVDRDVVDDLAGARLHADDAAVAVRRGRGSRSG